MAWGRQEAADTKLLADPDQHRLNHGDRERECFWCISGWVFLGSLDHDGAEVFDAIRCRECGGTGRIRY